MIEIDEEELVKEFSQKGVAVRSNDKWGNYFVRVTKDTIEIYEPTGMVFHRKSKQITEELEFLAWDLESQYSDIGFYYSFRMFEEERKYLKQKIQETRKAASRLVHRILDLYGDGCNGESCGDCVLCFMQNENN